MWHVCGYRPARERRGDVVPLVRRHTCLLNVTWGPAGWKTPPSVYDDALKILPTTHTIYDRYRYAESGQSVLRPVRLILD